MSQNITAPATIEQAPALQKSNIESNPAIVSLVKPTPVQPAITAVRQEPKTQTEEVRVYPNPFTNRISVELTNPAASDITLQLFDLNGRQVYRSGTYKTTTGKNVVTVNLPFVLSPGNYVLQVQVDGKTSKSVKLIKMN